jgi:hypothetical protein
MTGQYVKECKQNELEAQSAKERDRISFHGLTSVQLKVCPDLQIHFKSVGRPEPEPE